MKQTTCLSGILMVWQCGYYCTTQPTSLKRLRGMVMNWSNKKPPLLSSNYRGLSNESKWQVVVRLTGAEEIVRRSVLLSCPPCHQVSRCECVRQCVHRGKRGEENIWKRTSRHPLGWKSPALLIKPSHRQHTCLPNDSQMLRSTRPSIIRAVILWK